MNAPISVIILTQNEAVNIADCLRSVTWSDDVIVVDSGSTDGTLELAKQARPDVRVCEHRFQDFGDQRNWALDNTVPRHEWILFLDADERITPACAAAMGTEVRSQKSEVGGQRSGIRTQRSDLRPLTSDLGPPVGYYLCNRYFFLGKWIKHCTLYPSWQLRLLRRGRVRYRKEGHGQREVADGPLGYIREPYDHYGFSKGIGEWVARHDRYSSNEVELILRLRAEPLSPVELFAGDAVRRRRFLKRLAVRLPCRPLFRFLYMYLIRGGILDGRAGLTFCRLRFSHERHMVAKLAEDKNHNRVEDL